MTENREIAGPSEVAAVRLKAVRRQRGMSVKALAERCAELGAPKLNQSVITNIEVVGRRQDVGLTEVLVLAAALEVPPVLLFVPTDGPLQITPKLELHAPDLLAWVSGEGEPPMPVRRDGGTVRRWFEASAQMRLFREFRQAAALPVALAQPVVTVSDDERRERIVKALGELAELVNRMVESGVSPPPLPREVVDQLGRFGLRYIDQVTIAPDGSDDLVDLLTRAGLIARAEGEA